MWCLLHNLTVLASYPFEEPRLPWVGLFPSPPVPTQLLAANEGFCLSYFGHYVVILHHQVNKQIKVLNKSEWVGGRGR